LAQSTQDSLVTRVRQDHAWRARWKTAVRVTIPAAVFVVALAVLWRELQTIRPADVLAELGKLSWLASLIALILTALSYWTLTGYDAAGLRYIGRPLPYRRTALVSFIAYAFSNSVGLAGMGGAPLRYRYFLGLGISAGDVMRVVTFGYVTFWVGFLALAGLLFSAEPLPVPEIIELPMTDTRPIGALFIVALTVYLAWGVRRGRTLTFGGWVLPAPGPRMAGMQLVLGALDWLLAGAALYVLLPGEARTGLLEFLVVYLFAQTAGLVSQVPGGLGVFETLITLFLADEASAPALLGALLTYRALYYLMPLMAAVLILGVLQVREHRLAWRSRASRR
jgi:uncharacterized membrane protein YbhN (UPF0104 family)